MTVLHFVSTDRMNIYSHQLIKMVGQDLIRLHAAACMLTQHNLADPKNYSVYTAYQHG